MSVRLSKVAAGNLEKVLKLSVGEDQKGFVASNAVSIAQSKYYPALKTDAVYAGESMVGFAMYGFDPDDERFTLIRLMIDEKHQGKGYGRSATKAVLKRLKEEEGCKAVFLSYVPANKAAAQLYKSIDFKQTGEVDAESGEIVMKLDFSE